MADKLNRIFKLNINFSINATSRSLVDNQTNMLRKHIVPLIIDKNGSPFLLGSAVAIRFNSRFFLVTAHHVLAEKKTSTLLVFNGAGEAHPFSGKTRSFQGHDLAAVLLDSNTIAKISDIEFLDGSYIGSVADVDGRFYGTFAGYPHTAAKLHTKTILETPMEMVSGIAHEENGGFVAINFDKKAGAHSDIGHIIARDQHGKSGGAIFGMRIENYNVVPFQSAKLVGIGTDWKRKEKLLRGASSAIILELLKDFI
jgi:hypothetical protein